MCCIMSRSHWGSSSADQGALPRACSRAIGDGGSSSSSAATGPGLLERCNIEESEKAMRSNRRLPFPEVPFLGGLVPQSLGILPHGEDASNPVERSQTRGTWKVVIHTVGMKHISREMEDYLSHSNLSRVSLAQKRLNISKAIG